MANQSRKDTAMTTATDNTSTDNSSEVPVTNSDNSAGDSAETPTPNRDPGKMDANLYQAMLSQLEVSVNEHNKLAAEIKNAGDRVALKDSLKDNPENTNDADFVALVKRMTELSDALANIEREFDAKSEPFILDALKRSGVDVKQAKADELATTAKATSQYLNAMGASMDGIPTITGRSGRTNSGTGDGRGSGVPKYRNLEVYVDGKRAEQKGKDKDGNNVMKSNLTYGAQASNVPSDVFRAAFVEAQGTSDAASFKDRVEFTVKEESGTEHSVVVQKIAD